MCTGYKKFGKFVKSLHTPNVKVFICVFKQKMDSFRAYSSIQKKKKRERKKKERKKGKKNVRSYE